MSVVLQTSLAVEGRFGGDERKKGDVLFVARAGTRMSTLARTDHN
jgi:hypothetical protein